MLQRWTMRPEVASKQRQKARDRFIFKSRHDRRAGVGMVGVDRADVEVGDALMSCDLCHLDIT